MAETLDEFFSENRQDMCQQHARLIKGHKSLDFSKRLSHGDASFMQHRADKLSEAEPDVRHVCSAVVHNLQDPLQTSKDMLCRQES